MFAYCGNNPVMRVDTAGNWWDTFWDVVSLVSSVVEVIKDPTDVGAWVGLAGDVADVLLPGVSGLGEAADAIGVTRKAKRVAESANDVGRVIDNAVDAGKGSQRVFNTSKQGSKIFKGCKPVKGKSYRSSGFGRNRRYYDWDYTHNDIEVYDQNGNHLGSMDPITGKMYKAAVKGRRLW